MSALSKAGSLERKDLDNPNGREANELAAAAQKALEALTYESEAVDQQKVAHAIYCQNFGNDTAVLIKLAENLPVFTNKEAQRTVAKAIYDEKFGNDTAVLIKLAENLTAFTDEWAQQWIAKAIYEGKFGKNEDVLKELAKHLTAFTDENAQQWVAQAIYCQNFGNNEDVLIKLAENLTVFTAQEAQQYVAKAIYEGKFGNDTAVLIKLAENLLAENLPVFTDQDAQQWVAEAIYEGKFGKDKDVLLALAENLTAFTDPLAQQYVAKAIYDEKFGKNEDVLIKLAENLLAENLPVFTNKEAQRTVAEAIYEGKFGNDTAVLIKLAENLTAFTDEWAQQWVAHAIDEGKFGNDTAVLIKLAENLPVFTDLDAQRIVAKAIYEGKFGEDENVLIKLAENLLAENLPVFTDLDAQRIVAKAIYEGKFGKNEDVLIKLADNLDVFTDQDAQQWVAHAIYCQNFGNNKAVLVKLAENLTAFTDEKAQQWVAHAINAGRFGKNEDVLGELIKAPLTHRYIDTILDQLIDSVSDWPDNEKVQFFSEFKLSEKNIDKINLFNGEDPFKFFGTNQETSRICESYKFIDPYIQVNASLEAELKCPYPKIGCIVSKTENQDFNEYSSLKIGEQITINEETYTVSHPYTEVSKSITLRNAENPNKKLKIGINNTGKYTFNQTDGLENSSTLIVNPTVTKKIKTHYKITSENERFITMQEIDDKENVVANNEGINVPKHNNPSIDQYALDRRPAKYSIQKYPPYLICVDTTKVNPAFFEGWISTPNSDLYHHCFDHVSVYKLDENNVGIKKIDPQDLVGIREALPQWLQIAIDDATFNPDEYADSDIINFVANELMKTLEDSVSEADKTLVDQMRSIIKRCIAYKGNGVNIALNKRDDQHIKDEINRMCLPFIWDNKFSPIVTDFIHNQLNDDPIKIAKLGFLLGQLAKQGVLGYHHGDANRQNQANSLLYCLSKTCFDELKNIPNHGGVRFPESFFNHLESGICIEGLTDTLMSSNNEHHLGDVFKKASR